MNDRSNRLQEIAAEYADETGRIPMSAVRKIRDEVAALPATYTIVAHPPVFLPGSEEIVNATTLDEADKLARELSAQPRHLKAWVYRDGVKIAEYGMGYKYDRLTS